MTAIEFNSTFNASGRHFENETTQWSNLQKDCNFGQDPSSHQVARVFAYCLIIAISAFGNSVTIFVVWRDTNLRKIAFNFFIVNLAATDLTITLMYMPRSIVMWLRGSEWLVQGVFGSVLCKAVPFLHGVSILVSILTLLAMAVDRFFVIVFPLKKKITVKASKLTIAFIWLLAMAVRFPYIYSLEITFKETRDVFVCDADIGNAFDNSQARKIYYTFVFVAFYGFPFIVIIASYSAIIVTLRQKKPQLFGSNRERRGQTLDRASRKIFYLLLTITAAFIFCWLTYFIAQIVYDFIPCSLRFWRLVFAHSNSALNPCLYVIFNEKFQQGYKRLFSSFRCG